MSDKLQHSTEFKRGWDAAIEHLRRTLKDIKADDILV